MSPRERMNALETAVVSLQATVTEIQLRTPSRLAHAAHTCPTCARRRGAEMDHIQLALPDFETAVAELKRKLLSAALAEHDGVMKRAAESIGLKYTTFVEMANRLGVVQSRRRSNGVPPRSQRRTGTPRREVRATTPPPSRNETDRRAA